MLTYLTNPLYYDTDYDMLDDFSEIFVYGTNPLLLDTDGDSFTDGEEILAGKNPLKTSSNPAVRHFLTFWLPFIFGILIA